ncbi:VOC family protein [Kaistia geumhonensis]|uniref:Enzyme related to lactoylglutathione lyase n=1 Tax=Kaistia geumhonensis TaxID=410839 RepID=A0ABU0M7M5_9HYPH|nr:VOC family protein [Kaistia geumhonensis]MCX5477819.1 VOC family protein [Kaistia geumhonensis]MDQ0516969.1 putative enzyme related to lactoylglutathione lyase [Kaistia geumhonensis]
MAGHGTFCWNELMTRDAARAKDFYAKTLGWSFNSMPMGEMGDYHLAMMGDTMVAGIMEMGGPDFEGVPEHWFSYVEVDEVDPRVALLEKEGGSLVRPAFDVPGVGRIAIVQIPGGAVQGWMKPEQPSA